LGIYYKKGMTSRRIKTVKVMATTAARPSTTNIGTLGLSSSFFSSNVIEESGDLAGSGLFCGGATETGFGVGFEGGFTGFDGALTCGVEAVSFGADS
jgi:hypothetical protein